VQEPRTFYDDEDHNKSVKNGLCKLPQLALATSTNTGLNELKHYEDEDLGEDNNSAEMSKIESIERGRQTK
jgi:hypothetical protein